MRIVAIRNCIDLQVQAPIHTHEMDEVFMSDEAFHAEELRISKLYYTGEALKRRHKLPKHVSYWMDRNWEGLLQLQDCLREIQGTWPEIADCMDMPAMVACIARLSSVDSPTGRNGRAGGRNEIGDFLVMEGKRMDAINKQIADREKMEQLASA